MIWNGTRAEQNGTRNRREGINGVDLPQKEVKAVLLRVRLDLVGEGGTGHCLDKIQRGDEGKAPLQGPS